MIHFICSSARPSGLDMLHSSATGKRRVTRSISDRRTLLVTACYSVLISQAGCNGRVTSPPFFFFFFFSRLVCQLPFRCPCLPWRSRLPLPGPSQSLQSLDYCAQQALLDAFHQACLLPMKCKGAFDCQHFAHIQVAVPGC